MTYLNIDNTTVSLGPDMPAEPFQNVSTAQSLDNVIDAPSPEAEDTHNQSSHVWYFGDALVLEFDFGQEYDLTDLHFWNYHTEAYDVDLIEFSFLDADGALMDTLEFLPELGVGVVQRAEDYALDLPGPLRHVVATLSGTNGHVDFNNLGFTGTAASSSDVIGEAGRRSVVQSGPADWTQVTFSQTLDDPSVIMGPLSFNGSDPATVRVRNVTETGFEFQLDEWSYLDGVHVAETVSWLAVEAGTHRLDDGTVIRAGSAFADHEPVEVALGSAFDATPVTLAQIVTRAGGVAATTRIDDVTAGGFAVRVQEEEGEDGVHAVEEVDWIAADQGGSAAGGFLSTLTGDTVTQTAQSVGFGGSFSGLPALLADMQTFDGADPATVRQTSLDAGGTSIFIEEERSADPEVAHATEDVGVVALETGVLTGATAIGEARTVQVAQAGSSAWTQVEFSQAFDDPSVVMGPLSFNGSQPAAVRVRNVTETGFEFQVDEWDYLDGGHTLETISFLAIEAGAHTLADGTQIRAGSTTSDHTFSAVSFGDTDVTPVALSQIVTFNGSQAATARMRDVTATGFEVAVQEEEGNDGFHVDEEIDWIAITPGSAEGRHVALTGDVVTHVPQGVGLGTAFAGDPTPPALLAAMQTFDGADPATLRVTGLTQAEAMIFTEEETSLDSETQHTTEAVGIAAFQDGLIFA